MEEHKSALAALLKACEDQAHKKKAVMDDTFGKGRHDASTSLMMLANKSAEEAA